MNLENGNNMFLLSAFGVMISPLNTSTLSAHLADPLSLDTSTTMPREWLARLALSIDYLENKSRLTGNSGIGPLRLLRPYYPEGPERIHLYLIHPPGGLVCGDQLQIDIDLQAEAKALFTIPSAGKVYRSDRHSHKQEQSNLIRCGTKTQLEWLPQETIVYNGANGSQSLRLETEPDSSFILWEITALGRPATGAPFETGSFTQSLQINLGSLPVLVEKLRIDGSNDTQNANWGLRQQPVYGSMVAGYLEEGECQQLVNRLRDKAIISNESLTGKTAPTGHLHWSVTRKDRLIIVRALAPQSEPIKTLFHQIWEQCRPTLIDRAPHHPRIWST